MHRDELRRVVEDLRLVGADQQRVEVKSTVGKSILETLSAFSNGSGGMVIVGLNEREGFEPIAGFDASAERDALASRCQQLSPVVRPEIDLVPFEGSVVVVAKVPELLPRDKPCYITQRGRYAGSYLRTGDGDVRLSTYEVDRLVEEHTQPAWDEEPVTGSSVADLEPDVLESYLDNQRAARPKTFAQGDEAALKRLRVVVDGSLTLAGLLALGDYPQQFFPRLTLTFAVFPGVDKGEVGTGLRLLDSATLDGAIAEVVERAVALVAKNMRVGALIGDVYRSEAPDYPLVAVREAVVNALMHRDYSPAARGTPVQLNMFADRLEVVSPGGLYGTVTTRTLGSAGLSSSRNQRLATLLETVRFPGGGVVAENRGTGFAVMAAELQRAQLPPLTVRDDLTSFTVTFWRRRLAKPARSVKTKDKVWALLEEGKAVTAAELVAATGLSRTAVQRALNQLIDDQVAEAIEPARSPRQRYRRSSSTPS